MYGNWAGGNNYGTPFASKCRKPTNTIEVSKNIIKEKIPTKSAKTRVEEQENTFVEQKTQSECAKNIRHLQNNNQRKNHNRGFQKHNQRKKHDRKK